MMEQVVGGLDADLIVSFPVFLCVSALKKGTWDKEKGSLRGDGAGRRDKGKEERSEQDRNLSHHRVVALNL